MKEGSEEERDGFMKNVIIPTETGHIPLLLYFHLSNALQGRLKEDEGRLLCCVLVT